MYRNEFASPEHPPRILHLIHWLNPGGIESWLLAALRHVPRDLFAMDVCYKGPREGSLAPYAREAGAELLHCPLGPTVLPFIRRLKQILVRGRYSLLHVHTHVHSGPAVYAANSVGVPVVTTFHNTQQPPETTFTRFPVVRSARAIYLRRSMRYAIRHSSVSNGVSKAVAVAATKAAGLASSKCQVLYLGCPRPQTVSPQRLAEYRDELHLPHDKPVIIHVGSFQARKNHAGIIRVFRKVIEATPTAQLLLIGDGPLRPAVREKVISLGLDRHVRLLGVRRDATAIMQLGHAMLFPSLHEGLSIALMEASAIGLPIVASDIPGNREATDNGTSARLHPVANEDDMASSLVELLDNPAEQRRFADRGRQTYEQTFSMEASAQRLTSLYRRTMQLAHSNGAASVMTV